MVSFLVDSDGEDSNMATRGLQTNFVEAEIGCRVKGEAFTLRPAKYNSEQN